MVITAAGRRLAYRRQGRPLIASPLRIASQSLARTASRQRTDPAEVWEDTLRWSSAPNFYRANHFTRNSHRAVTR